MPLRGQTALSYEEFNLRLNAHANSESRYRFLNVPSTYNTCFSVFNEK